MFTTALRELYKAAGSPPYKAVVKRAQVQQPAISMSTTSLSDWLAGKHVPAKPETAKFLVRYLRSEAARRNRSFRVASDERWEEMREAALRERNEGRQSGRPPKRRDRDEFPDRQDTDDDSETPQPVFATVEEYVTERFIPMYRRILGSEFRWCPRWWEHAEAISRLTAIWHSWEVKRLEPGTGIPEWYRDYLDPQLPILMGPNGPFAMCNEYEHKEISQARLVPAPDGYWDPS